MKTQTAEEKENTIREFVEIVGKMSIAIFNEFDLKTHIDAMVVDSDNNEEYVITINKVSNGELFKGGEIVFTKKQRNNHTTAQIEALRERLREKSLFFHEFKTDFVKTKELEETINDFLKDMNDGK